MKMRSAIMSTALLLFSFTILACAQLQAQDALPQWYTTLQTAYVQHGQSRIPMTRSEDVFIIHTMFKNITSEQDDGSFTGVQTYTFADGTLIFASWDDVGPPINEKGDRPSESKGIIFRTGDDQFRVLYPPNSDNWQIQGFPRPEDGGSYIVLTLNSGEKITLATF